jgi:hypothetical protein
VVMMASAWGVLVVLISAWGSRIAEVKIIPLIVGEAT